MPQVDKRKALEIITSKSGYMSGPVSRNWQNERKVYRHWFGAAQSEFKSTSIEIASFYEEIFQLKCTVPDEKTAQVQFLFRLSPSTELHKAA